MGITTIAAAAAALAAVLAIATSAVATDGRPSSARSTVRLADGTTIGVSASATAARLTEVTVTLDVPLDATAVRSFHGFHIHANDNSANGDGCQADPATQPATWFVSADGHLQHEGQRHGAHAGDLPSLHLNSDGSARTTFAIDRIDLAELAGRASSFTQGPTTSATSPSARRPTNTRPTAPKPSSAPPPPATPATASLAVKSRPADQGRQPGRTCRTGRGAE